MRHDLFITELWEFDFPYHAQIKKQINELVNSSSKDYLEFKDNPSLTTYGGNEIWYESQIELQSLIEIQIKKMLNNVSKDRPWVKGQWENFEQWLNINNKGNFNPPHIHPNHHYSGCYYIKFPENAGYIHFLDPRPQHRICSPDLVETKGNPYNSPSAHDSSVFTYKIKEGKVIIFPSWLMHYVDPNPNEDLRISIAFNSDYISLPEHY
tara:strand:- start:2227 stop:2853 length:627 start_codon:yes stop_codon:yes gene_type:complete